MTTEYFAVYDDEDDPLDDPGGLFRRANDETGRLTASDAYHPRTGWQLTDYWLRTARGEPDLHLVPVDERRAQEIQELFDRIWAGRQE